jgi:uncharacterized protein (DUF983 family)
MEMKPMTDKSIWTGIRRGLSRQCPACGRGALFGGFLRVRGQCDACGADNTLYPSDDMPAYLTILVVGHLIVPALLLVDHVFAPALWLQFAVWPALTGLLCILLLPPVKGGVVGLCWATGMVRPDGPG